jgi:hypothetical protein
MTSNHWQWCLYLRQLPVLKVHNICFPGPDVHCLGAIEVFLDVFCIIVRLSSVLLHATALEHIVLLDKQPLLATCTHEAFALFQQYRRISHADHAERSDLRRELVSPSS